MNLMRIYPFHPPVFSNRVALLAHCGCFLFRQRMGEAAYAALAQAGGLIPIALSAMAGLAALQVCQECKPQTLELVLSILQHPVTN